MCPSRLLSVAAFFAATLTSASAADLSRLDRTLVAEPNYNTRDPRYCLLVFGKEATTHVWLVRDGDVLHVYASLDGKGPKVWRRIGGPNAFHLGDVWEDGGNVCHKQLYYYQGGQGARLRIKVGDKSQEAGRDYRGNLEFAASAQAAPVVHFNGPLTLDLFRLQGTLDHRGYEDLTAVVGTHGIGPGTFALFHCDAYPKNAWPEAIIEFPAKDGGKPIVTKVRLAEE